MKSNMVVEELSSDCCNSQSRVVLKQIYEFSQFKIKIYEYEIKHSVALSCIKNNARLCLQFKIKEERWIIWKDNLIDWKFYQDMVSK